MVHSPDYRTPWNVRNIYVILATCSRYGKCNATRVLCADELWSVFRVNENKIIFIYQRKKKPYESRAERRRRWSEWMRRFNHQIKEDYFTLSLSLCIHASEGKFTAEHQASASYDVLFGGLMLTNSISTRRVQKYWLHCGASAHTFFFFSCFTVNWFLQIISNALWVPFGWCARALYL